MTGTTAGGGADDEGLQTDPVELRELARRLKQCGDELRGVASGLERAIPPVPEDEHSVATTFIAFDEARERVIGKVAETFTLAEKRLMGVAQAVSDANAAPPFAPDATGRP